MKKPLSRRQFLSHSSTGIASAALLSSAGQFGLMSSASAAGTGVNDYKALICVMLRGGADSFNMLVPYDHASYNEYQTIRTDVALNRNTLLPLNGQHSGKKLALHPKMKELQLLFNQNEVAFVSNVGTLVEPTHTAQLKNGTAKMPLGLHSHSDQQNQWQTSTPDARSGTGWGGRMADLLKPVNGNAKISMNISISGSNLFQSGTQTQDYSIIPEGNGTVLIDGYEDEIQANAIEKMYSQSYPNILRQAYTNVFNQSVTANREFSNAISQVGNFTTQFAADGFSQQMHMLGRAIVASKAMGIKRQTFFVDLPGWDHHDEVLKGMNEMLPWLSQGLASFQAAMKEVGMDKEVTTFTMSEFGRTLTSNGKGTDHGWGGNVMVMGGSVKGGQVYGEYPSLAEGNPLDTGRGVLLPTTSTDVYYAELAKWYGVGSSDLNLILPNIGRFYSTNSTQNPMGFMA